MKFDLPERFFTLVSPGPGPEYRVRVFDTHTTEPTAAVRTIVPSENATGSVHARALGLESIVRNFPNGGVRVDEGVVWKESSPELRDYLENAREDAWNALVYAVGAAMRSKFEADTDPASWSEFLGDGRTSYRMASLAGEKVHAVVRTEYLFGKAVGWVNGKPCPNFEEMFEAIGKALRPEPKVRVTLRNVYRALHKDGLVLELPKMSKGEILEHVHKEFGYFGHVSGGGVFDKASNALSFEFCALRGTLSAYPVGPQPIDAEEAP